MKIRKSISYSPHRMKTRNSGHKKQTQSPSKSYGLMYGAFGGRPPQSHHSVWALACPWMMQNVPTPAAAAADAAVTKKTDLQVHARLGDFEEDMEFAYD